MESFEGKTHSVMESLRLGSPHDLYYYTHANCHKQSIPSIVDNRFYQALNNLRQGSTTFIISVDQGISDVIMAVKLPEQGVGNVDYSGLAIPRAWIYQALARVSVRYGSSSQYFWTGQQVMIENLREMPNPQTRDSLYQLGGAAMVGGAVGSGQAGDFAGDNLYAYAYLNLPHNSPNGSLMKPNPFPSELIGQPIVVTVEMTYLPNLFSSANAAGSVEGAPTEFESGYFQVKQVHAKDAGELMSMPGGKGHAYAFPLKAFYQNEIQVNMSGNTQQQVLLTGFRNGEVRSIICWITKDSDVNGERDESGRFAKNFNKFIIPRDVTLTYNGTIYYRAFDIASQMWNLVSTETPSQLNATIITQDAGALSFTDSNVSNWLEIPFSQVYEQLSGSHMYVSGKLIQNAVVNLQLTLPDTDAYTLHAVYAYNANLMIADKGCEYFFG